MSSDDFKSSRSSLIANETDAFNIPCAFLSLVYHVSGSLLSSALMAFPEVVAHASDKAEPARAFLASTVPVDPGTLVGVFAGCGRLAEAFQAEWGDNTLLYILPLSTAARGPELKSGLRARGYGTPISACQGLKRPHNIKDYDGQWDGRAAMPGGLWGPALWPPGATRWLQRLGTRTRGSCRLVWLPRSWGNIPSQEYVTAASTISKPDTPPGLSGWTHHRLAFVLQVPAFLKALYKYKLTAR
ncbi:hypothetical protein EHS25_005700 [Saitozyma podzolica]|uniref:Uncharacterized protein n=1 Tax=Saitozyma podzolica TaxID=1890683 RepID=A0A427XVX0_9TREE|nr:hypothetical protein EHS25_005700 [Saitozyma podzolica]